MAPNETVSQFAEPADAPACDALTSKQRRLIAALLSERTVEDAAKRAGVSRTTAFRWMADPLFAEALKACELEALEGTTRALVALSGKAVEVIASILDDPTATPATRLRAADAALGRLLQLREIVALEARIEALEAAQGRTEREWR